MAHEIQNPLEALNLNLALLIPALRRSSPVDRTHRKQAKYLRYWKRRSRGSRQLRIISSPSRVQQRPDEEIRLDDLMRQIVDLLANQARSPRKSPLLELQTEGNPHVLGSEDQLKQAFLNLVINSLEAMPQGGLARAFAPRRS